MAKRGLSIEIGVQQVKICEMDFHKKHPRIYKTHVFDTPMQAIVDGYIQDKTAFASIMKKELKKAGMRSRNVIFTVACSAIANREVTIPLVKDKQIASIVEASAQDYFPIDISEYSVAYSILERNTEGEEKTLRLLLFAAPNTLVKNYYSFADEMAFDIEAIDYVGNSSMQLLKRQVGMRTGVTVQINEETTLISIIENGRMVVQRTLAYGMQSSVDAVIENTIFGKFTEKDATEFLTTEQVVLPNFDYEQAEAEVVSILEENLDAENVFRAKMEVTETLAYHVNNVHRLIDYYHSKNPDKPIDIVYLTGVGAEIQGIAELFQSELEANVVKIKVISGVDFTVNKKGLMNDQIELIPAIGATIAPLKFVLKDDVVTKSKVQKMHSAKFIFGVSAVTAVLIAGISVVQYKTEELTNRTLTQKVESLSSIEEIYNENLQANTYYNELNEMYMMTVTGNEYFKQLIEELEDKLPVNMVVTSIAANSDGITINLESTTKISVAKLLINLKQVTLLTDVTVPAVSSSVVEGKVEKYVFSVTANYAQEAVIGLAVEEQFEEQTVVETEPAEETVTGAENETVETETEATDEAVDETATTDGE